jgi:5S rRNA maturation endonuclease (ribonuclease M5)
VRDNRSDELHEFKAQINLAEYAASQGYQIDRRESSRNSAVMRRESDNDKIIIATDIDGHAVYFSVRDDQDNGSIIDFVQSRQRLNLGQVRKELRPWIGAVPVPLLERICKPEPTTSDRRAVIGAFAQTQAQPPGGHSYLLSRGVSTDTLADPRFGAMVRQDSRGNAVFPHYDSAGLSGYELKNNGFTGFSRGGEKRVWHSANIDEAVRVVVVESAIDALSHAQITGDHEAAYISVGGQPSLEQWAVLQAILLDKHSQGAVLVVGTDADVAGDQLAEQVAALVPGVERERPDMGDWNEQLQQTGLQAEFQRSRRETDDYEGPSFG